MKIFFGKGGLFMVSLNILSKVQRLLVLSSHWVTGRKEGWELLQLLVLKFLLHCVTAGEVEAQKNGVRWWIGSCTKRRTKRTQSKHRKWPSQLKGIHNGPPPWRGSCRR